MGLDLPIVPLILHNKRKTPLQVIIHHDKSRERFTLDHGEAVSIFCLGVPNSRKNPSIVFSDCGESVEILMEDAEQFFAKQIGPFHDDNPPRLKTAVKPPLWDRELDGEPPSR
jgi:hypothetical protein